MKLPGRIDEDEMVAVFLRGELASDRWAEGLRAMLARDGRDARVLSDPDLTDAADNDYRRHILDEHRAYERREGLFDGFPREIDWFRASLARDELLDVLFIDWDWWLRISGGSRRPRDAAQRIHAGEVAGVTAQEHEPLAAAFWDRRSAPAADRRHLPGARACRTRRGPLPPDRVGSLPRARAGGGRDRARHLRRHRALVRVVAGLPRRAPTRETGSLDRFSRSRRSGSSR